MSMTEFLSMQPRAVKVGIVFGLGVNLTTLQRWIHTGGPPASKKMHRVWWDQLQLFYDDTKFILEATAPATLRHTMVDEGVRALAQIIGEKYLVWFGTCAQVMARGDEPGAVPSGFYTLIRMIREAGVTEDELRKRAAAEQLARAHVQLVQFG